MVSNGAMQSSGHGGRPFGAHGVHGRNGSGQTASGPQPPATANANTNTNTNTPQQEKPGAPFNRAKDRVDAIPHSKTIDTKDIRFRYAYVSQRGFYPDDPFKPNQDSYCVHEAILKSDLAGNPKQDALFAVFDGHGKSGHDCARYARNNLPHKLKLALDEARRNSPEHHDLHREQIEAAFIRAHLETNEGLARNTQIDDSLSGTTAISVYWHGRRNRLTIANVGDSRAIIGTLPVDHPKKPPENGRRGPLVAFPLSRDQTPYRKDERKRVRKAGARILSLDQLEGVQPMPQDDGEQDSSGADDLNLGEELDEDGDPPRIWHKTEEWPGCAFTRSIGDHKAEELGVIAEPELLTREVHPNDKVIVVASDGVWEFLTNQNVIDLCTKFRDPLEACRAIVAEAYELWLQYELRTDDITVICIFVDEIKCPLIGSSSQLDVDPKTLEVADGTERGDESDNEEIRTTLLPETGYRPVRKHVSKDKQKEINKLKAMGNVAAQKDDEDEDDKFDWSKLVTPKTDAEKKSIEDAVLGSVMFRNCDDEQRQLIFSCMESVPVKKDTWVIKQGDPGDRFYIIDEGFFEVRILPDGMKFADDETGHGGNIVHLYEGSRAKHIHPAFGEIALMYSAPRTASIYAQSDGHLWALHRSVFRQVLNKGQDKYKDLKKVLKKIPCLSHLDNNGLTKIASNMTETTFLCGDNITEQGYPGKRLYVIKTGSGYSVQMVPGQTKRGTVKAGDFVGDEVFNGDTPGRYNKTVTVLQTCTCWQLDSDVAHKVMVSLLIKKK